MKYLVWREENRWLNESHAKRREREIERGKQKGNDAESGIKDIDFETYTYEKMEETQRRMELRRRIRPIAENMKNYKRNREKYRRWRVISTR